MLQRFIGVSIGALVTFVLLLLFYGGVDANAADQAVVNWRIVSDSTQAFLVASVVGAIASFLWPIVIARWLARRIRHRRDDEVQSEVQRQLAEQQKTNIDR